MKNHGLHQVSEADLVRLLKAVSRDQVPAPITRAGLLLTKFADVEAHLDVLVGQSKRTAIALLSAVVRERRERSDVAAHQVSAVWDGPAQTGTGVRSTRDVILELVATAEHSLLFTGANLDRDRGLLRSLEAALQGRALKVRVILQAVDLRQREGFIALANELYHASPLRSHMYVPVPERIQGELGMCLLVDQRRGLLLAGAAPDPEADENQVTVGFAIEHPQAVLALETQWNRLIEIEAVVPLETLLVR